MTHQVPSKTTEAGHDSKDDWVLDKSRERIVVGPEVYFVDFSTVLCSMPEQLNAEVYENTTDMEFKRNTYLTRDDIEGLRKQRTDPECRVFKRKTPVYINF